MQLTGTNRSIGLIALIVYVHDTRREIERPTLLRSVKRLLRNPQSVLRRPGGLSEEPEPDPIPNSAVKTLCAHGTAA